MDKKKLISYLLALVFVLGLFLVNTVLDNLPPILEEVVPTHGPATQTDPAGDPDLTDPYSIDEDGHYNSKEEVALYIHLYGKLPEN